MVWYGGTFAESVASTMGARTYEVSDYPLCYTGWSYLFRETEDPSVYWRTLSSRMEPDAETHHQSASSHRDP